MPERRKNMGTYRETKLKDTVSLMCSDDYKERFKAEYMQVCVRYQKLKAMLDKWDEGKLNFQFIISRSKRWLTISPVWKHVQRSKTSNCNHCPDHGQKLAEGRETRT